MQALDDIFAIWKSFPEMAKAIGSLADTVYRWKKKGRIPEDWWQNVIDAAAVRGKRLTASDLLAANKPTKLRGRAAHKIRSLRRRRPEVRVES